MAQTTPSTLVDSIHGKVKKNDKGYYYHVNGKQFYRERKETYQKRQSPRQRWITQSFAYAQGEMNRLNTLEAQEAYTAEWLAAGKLGPDGKRYSYAYRWKLAMIKRQWLLDNPFENWCENNVPQTQLRKKPHAVKTSATTLDRQIAELTARLDSLKARRAAWNTSAK